MLNYAILFFCVVVVLFIAFVVFKLILPTQIFFQKSARAIDLFNMLQAMLEAASKTGKKDIESQEISINYNIYHYKFANINEAYRETEKMCNEALKYYNMLVAMNIATVEAQLEKDNLIDICNKIRLKRWNKT